jgi:hypothetical protein
MCELSIKDNHDLGQPCQTLNPRDEDTMKFVMNQLVGLMNKAHGHAAEEVDETGNSKLHLHAENLNRFKTQRSLRSEEDHSENDEEQFPYQPSLKSFVQSSQQSGWGESQNQWLGNLESSDRHSGEPENQSRGNLQILGQQQEITERDPEIQVTQTFRKRNGVEHQSQFIPDMQQSQFPSDRESYRQPAFNMGVHQEHTQLKPKQLALTLSRQAENTPAHLRRADEQSFSGTDED